MMHLIPSKILLLFGLAGLAVAGPNGAPAGPDLLLLDNGTAKVGIDRSKGASITWLSWAQYPKNIAWACTATIVLSLPGHHHRGVRHGARHHLIPGTRRPVPPRQFASSAIL